jgi:hypothetical protein
MATVLSAMDLMAGKTSKGRPSSGITQPIQMLPKKKKDATWRIQNLDWYEQLGLKQLKYQAKKMLKNYRLAKGIIDKSDYIVDEGNEYSDIIHKLTKDMDEETALSLKFYPIIPNVINVLTGEFSKRNNKLLIRATDDYSQNEMLEQKRAMIEEYLVSQAQMKIAQNLQSMGVEVDSEEGQQAMSQIKSLPEIEQFFKKSYRGIAEQWATHQLSVDDDRFKMYELENVAFRDSLITDREFWHIRLKEDDYEIEVWRPQTVFYHKSPEVRYIADGNYVGRILMMSVPDVIDRYGYQMTDEQIKCLESSHQVSSKLMSHGHDYTASYDTSRPYTDQQPNSVHYETLMAAKTAFDDSFVDGHGWYDFLYSDNDMFTQGMVRVTEVYWKSQRKVGYLTSIDEEGNIKTQIVTEDFEITEKPIYDTSRIPKKDKTTLLYGEHVDWIWVNEVWKGIKVGSTHSTMTSPFDPIYLEVKPLEFQFKGSDNPFNAKLPVEGCVFSDRDTKPFSLVDLMKPFQIMYNLVNNQISDILIDELGTVILIDQNMLPKQSMGEEWGRGNMAKAYVAMKNFQMLPIDTSITNTENSTSFNQFTVANLEQVNRLVTRIQIAEYSKMEAFSVVGITPQRVGATTSTETATGNNIALNNSYSQTEHYFTQHMNFLMPRVREMMLDAAQYYNSTKKSVRLSYINSKEENIFFEIEGDRLMLRDLNVFCNSKPDQRNVLEQLKQLAVNNNTTNATIYDLAKIVESNSVSEVLSTLKASVEKAQELQSSEMQQNQALLDKQLEAQAYEKELERIAKMEETDKLIQKDITVAEIRALGFAKDQDIDDNQIPDALEADKFRLQQQAQYDKIALDKKKEDNKMDLEQRKMDLEREKLRVQKEIERMKLANPVAGEKKKKSK